MLSRDLLQRELGVTLESFKAGKDKGIDLRHSEPADDSLIVQCKHYAGSPIGLLLSHLEKTELPKIRLLSPQRYIITTSIGLSPNDKEKLLSVLTPFCRNTGDILGREDLNNLLGKFPEIERKNFKLWMSSAEVLQRILNASIYQKTAVGKETIERRVKLYVMNPSYDKAKHILDSKHYCIIAGIPGIGKTTLAEILCFEISTMDTNSLR